MHTVRCAYAAFIPFENDDPISNRQLGHAAHKRYCQEILKAEGGFVNDPDDPGGPTNYGVTLKTMKRLAHDLNQDGLVDIADLKQLSAAQAVQIFTKDYFYKPQIDQLPHMLHAPVFDMYVNAGSHAVKVLQRTLILFDKEITVDGVIGPITIAATQKAARRAPDHFSMHMASNA